MCTFMLVCVCAFVLLWGRRSELLSVCVRGREDRGLPLAYPSSLVVGRINLFLLTTLAGMPRVCVYTHVCACVHVCGERLSEVKNTINSTWPWLMAVLEEYREMEREGRRQETKDVGIELGDLEVKGRIKTKEHSRKETEWYKGKGRERLNDWRRNLEIWTRRRKDLEKQDFLNDGELNINHTKMISGWWWM